MPNRILAWWLLSGTAFAQVELYSRDGALAGDEFGTSVCVVGDVDRDGHDDLAVGAPRNDSGVSNGGQVVVISGRTRQVIRTWDGLVPGARYGAALAACGDLDGDGAADVVVGAPSFTNGPGGGVFVLSGGSGASLFQWNGAAGFGEALAANGDVTGDQVHDVLVGSPLAGDVWVFDGASGAVVRQHSPASFAFGSAVTFLGDVTGDGTDEYAAGDPDTWGSVRVYRGSTGALHWSASGNFGDELGVALLGCGDLTGDGLPDLIAGAEDDGSFGSDGRGYFRLFDGVGGTVVQTVDGASFDANFGASLAAAGDLDGDGRAEFLVGHRFTNPNGAVELRRGSDRGLLVSMASVSSNVAWGQGLTFGDVSGDGLADVVIGAPRADSAGLNAGSVHVVSIVRAPVAYCASEINSLGCTPHMGSSGTCSATQPAPFAVTATQVLNQKVGLLFYGSKPRQTPYQGGHMCIVAPTRRTATLGSNGAPPPANDCSGAFSVDFNARIQSGVDPGLIAGEQVYAQYWSRDPADSSTTNLTNALAFHIAL